MEANKIPKEVFANLKSRLPINYELMTKTQPMSVKLVSSTFYNTDAFTTNGFYKPITKI